MQPKKYTKKQPDMFVYKKSIPMGKGRKPKKDGKTLLAGAMKKLSNK